MEKETYAEQGWSPGLSFDGWRYDSDDNQEDYYDHDEEYYDEDDDWYEYLFCFYYGDSDDSSDEEEIPEAD